MTRTGAVGLDVRIVDDGAELRGGLVDERLLKWLGSDTTITGVGSEIYTFPLATDTIVGRISTDTLQNKTLESAVLNTALSGTAVLDEDDMVSNSATKVATQQSIKAYVGSKFADSDEFIELTDTPASYTGEGGKFVKVNATPDGLEFADIAAGDLPTGIDAAKIADGSVSNAEFQHLDGLTSDIQTQLDLKLVIANNLSDLNNAVTARTNLGLGTAAVQDIGTGANNIPQLDGSGKLVDNVIPVLAISEYQGNFADLATALADAGVQASQRGDWFTVDTSGGLSYIVTTDNPTIVGDVTLIATPTDAVSSVNGKTGVVIINPDDLDDTATTNKFVTAAILTDIGLNTTHRTSDGSDHSFIDQDVTESGTPTFVSVLVQTNALDTDAINVRNSLSTQYASIGCLNHTGAWMASIGYSDVNVDGYEQNVVFIATNNLDIVWTNWDETVVMRLGTDNNLTVLGNVTGANLNVVDWDAAVTKLAGIEALADVTDATNVNAAGATMNADTDISTNGWVLDEDDMVSDSAVKVATQQSIKKYIDDSILTPIVEKSITVEDPSDSEDITIFFTNRAITITEMRAVLNNGTDTPSVTWTIRHSTDRSAAGNEVVTDGTTTTSVSTGSDVTSFDDATIPANSFIWLATTAQSGTVPNLSITLIATID